LNTKKPVLTALVLAIPKLEQG